MTGEKFGLSHQILWKWKTNAWQVASRYTSTARHLEAYDMGCLTGSGRWEVALLGCGNCNDVVVGMKTDLPTINSLLRSQFFEVQVPKVNVLIYTLRCMSFWNCRKCHRSGSPSIQHVEWLKNSLCHSHSQIITLCISILQLPITRFHVKLGKTGRFGPVSPPPVFQLIVCLWAHEEASRKCGSV